MKLLLSLEPIEHASIIALARKAASIAGDSTTPIHHAASLTSFAHELFVVGSRASTSHMYLVLRDWMPLISGIPSICEDYYREIRLLEAHSMTRAEA